MVKKFDFLVIGSGIAGMSFALKVASRGKVALICKTTLEEANTYFAQGGIASVTNLLVDNFDKHIEDTMIAGDWISDRAAVEKVVREAPSQIKALIDWGVDFDRNENGEFDLHREGGHSEFRILHHADNTGAEIQESLIKAVRKHPNITIFDHHFAIEILTQHHLGVEVTRQTPDIECYGAYVLDINRGRVLTMLALKIRKSGSQIMLINASAQLNKLLRDLGVAKLFKFVSGDDSAPADGGTKISFGQNSSLLSTAQTVVDAHKTRVEADSSNAEKFDKVIEFAEQDVQRLKDAGK